MTAKIKEKLHKTKNDVIDSQEDGAREYFMQEIFYDFYANRGKVYKMNFVRGLFFGFGSVLGGTVVIGVLIWLLSLFVDFPLIGEYLKLTQDALDQSQ